MDDDVVRLKEIISKLKSEREELRESNRILDQNLGESRDKLEKFKMIADFAHNWEMWIDPDGKIRYVSPSFRDLTGYSPEELIADPGLTFRLIYPDDQDQYAKYISDSVNFLAIKQSLNFRILTRSKQVRWCEIKCRAVYDRRGKYLGQRASIGDITRLVTALGEIETLEGGRAHDQRMQEKYIDEIESKDREMVSFLMSLSQKNEALQYIKRTLQKLDTKNVSKEQVYEIIRLIDSTLRSTESWDDFLLHFEKVHPGFFDRLTAAYPGLTQKEKKLSAYLRLQLSTKEIAILLNITPASAEISRVRLRKKLGLSRNLNLVNHICAI